MRRWGSSTGNGAGCPTRRADSVGSSHTSVVASMNSSLVSVLSAGRPRSKRPLLATITRSERSRNTGLDGWRNEPQANEPAAPRALIQTTSPRSSSRRRS